MTREGARAAARRLISHLKAPLEIDGRQLAMPPSIGVASFLAKTAEELLDAADLAMHKAKRSSDERSWHRQRGLIMSEFPAGNGQAPDLEAVGHGPRDAVREELRAGL